MKHKVLGKEIERLINALSKLPSIGNKTASRLSLFLMKNSPELTMEIARSMVEARKRLKLAKFVIILFLITFAYVWIQQEIRELYV